jgi:hypothetical protein
MTPGELESLIDRGDVEACIAAFQGMPETDRRKLGATAVARLRELGEGLPAQFNRFLDGEALQLLPSILMDRERLARFRVASVAVLATATVTQWRRVKSRALPSDDALFRIVSDRRPEWLGELVEHICDREETFGSRWSVIRRLVRAGLCGTPKSPRYIDRMLGSLPAEALKSRITLKDVLVGDPGLLEHEIWQIFSTEPEPGLLEISRVVTRSPRPELTWEVALTELAAEGRISRTRLLDACLDGLARDFHDVRARWFALLHDRLKPSPEELAARGPRYLGLLGSRNTPTIDFAMKVIKGLLKSAQVDREAVVDCLVPALHARTKGTVKAALRLLDLAAEQACDGSIKERVAAVGAAGLVHEAPDVQAAVLDLIERHGDRRDRRLREVLEPCIAGIAPSLRGRLEAWLGATQERGKEPTGEELGDLARRAAALDPHLAALAGVPNALAVASGERADCPGPDFDGTEIPRLDPERRLMPINDLDTVIELCSRLIEDPRPPEDIDRCVDAISRLCGQRPEDFARRTAPLVARLRQQLGGRLEVPPYLLSNLGVIVLSWLTEAVPTPLPFDKYRAFQVFLSTATCALARRIARHQSAPWLAAPTHAGGWIDPRTLVVRLHEHARLRIAAEPEELVLAILRIAPDQRAAALADARYLPGEPGAAIRYALGSVGETIGPTAALWVAAARARAPWSDDPAVEARHPGLGPDAGRAAAYHIDGNQMIERVANEVTLRIGREPTVPAPEPAMLHLPTVCLHAQDYISSDQWPAPASVWPAALESFCACGARQLVRSIEESSDWQGLRGFLLPLLDPDTRLRPISRLLVAVGLNAKLPETAGLAADVLVAAIGDGRLDAETMGASLRTVWQMRVESWIYRPANDPLCGQPHTVAFVKPTRWAKALGDVARSSPLHARIIARAIEMFLADEASTSRSAPTLLPFLELLLETSVETGRAVSAEARAFLGRLATGGKTGRVVANLLALREAADSPARKTAALQTLANRIARAERWMGISAPGAASTRSGGSGG